MKQGKTRNQNKYSLWKLHHSIRHTDTRIRLLFKTKYITHARKKTLLLKEIRFPHRTSPYTYCHSLCPNQFSLLSKASPSDCDFSVQIIRYRAPVLISPSFRFPHLFHHHYPPYQSPPRPWYICFCLRNLQQRHFRFCLLRIHPVSLQWEIPVWNKMLSLRTRTKIQIRNILHFLKFKN